MKRMIMTIMLLLMMTCSVYAGEYKDGEEIFYNDIYNHDNADLVYDSDIVKEYRAAKAKKAKITDKKIVRQYCEKHYDGMKVRFLKNPSYKTITTRKGTVIVEIIKSKSRGRYGYTRDGSYIRYNKKVKKNKTVTSYLIYNPDNNAEDDIVAVVDNKKIR